MKTTDMAYQVEVDIGAEGHVAETGLDSLAQARVVARKTKKQCAGARVIIARYDRSGRTDYYELVDEI